jgi:hypothetical protein
MYFKEATGTAGGALVLHYKYCWQLVGTAGVCWYCMESVGSQLVLLVALSVLLVTHGTAWRPLVLLQGSTFCTTSTAADSYCCL